ncbi:hypothetical protein [Sebaldella sp. S0638]|uniref:hypothetical protein n=1 Tax=Sebaldella sp. S0638 TaxID=2957809 RepID=UPI0020A1170E|nr:hypothetical protein [Sebaldella sp. S0638]MCP1224864.1 hypothetical protein [Sebaldella sp. S0638]
MKNKIIVLLIFTGIVSFSNKANTLSQDYKNIIEQAKKDAKIDYKLLYGYTNKWWTGYSDETLNNFISSAFTASTNAKTMQKKMTDIQSSFNRTKKEENTDKPERISKKNNEVKLVSGDFYGPDSLKIRLIYPGDLINRLDAMTTNKNSELEVLELAAKWASSSVSMLAAKLYGYYIYLENEERNIKERLDILVELEKLEEIKLSLKRGDGESLINVQSLKTALENQLTENAANRRTTERSMEILLGGNKQGVKNITAGIKSNPDTEIYTKIKRPDKIASDSIKDRVDAGFYYMIIKAEKESLYPYTASGYDNFWITGDGENITAYEQTAKREKITDSLYFQRYEENSYFDQKPAAALLKSMKQYNDTIINSYNEVNSALGNAKSAYSDFVNDNKIFEEQKNIFADKKNKLDAGMVSKYDYYNIQYNYLTQELNNIQLGFKSFISEVDFIYSLGGQNGTNKK